MRILHVNKYYSSQIGGIESIAQTLATGVGGDILCCDKVSRTENNGNNAIYRTRSLLTLFSLPISLEFFSRFKQLAPKYDCIILHHPFPLANIAHILFARKSKIIVWYHSDIVRQRIIAWLLSPIFKLSFKFASSIIVSSNNLLNHSRQLQPYKHKSQVIPFGVDLDYYLASRQIYQEARKIQEKYPGNILLCVGRLVYYEGFNVAIEAMSHVDAKLIIIGEGPDKKLLEQQVTSKGVENKVVFLPSQKDLRPYYYAATLLLFPSVLESEAFGLVQLEALASGLPVINTALPTGVPEVSLHGETGFTVPPKDSDALALATNKLLGDTNLRNQFSANARVRAKNVFSQEIFLQKHQVLLRSILK